MKKEGIFTNLQSNGLFGKRPIIGLLIFLIGTGVFVILAYNLVNQGPLIKWDLPLANFFHNLALSSSPFITYIMIASYYIGFQGIIVLDIFLGVYFISKKRWREFSIAAVAFIGGALLFKLFSNMFNRPRPFLLFDKIVWTGSPNIPGFPSGHTLNIVITLGFLAYLLLPQIKSYRRRILLIVTAIIATLWMGLSRLYVGDHYLTDILAGYALGFAWLGISCTIVELLFKKT